MLVLWCAALFCLWVRRSSNWSNAEMEGWSLEVGDGGCFLWRLRPLILFCSIVSSVLWCRPVVLLLLSLCLTVLERGSVLELEAAVWKEKTLLARQRLRPLHHNGSLTPPAHFPAKLGRVNIYQPTPPTHLPTTMGSSEEKEPLTTAHVRLLSQSSHKQPQKTNLPLD